MSKYISQRKSPKSPATYTKHAGLPTAAYTKLPPTLPIASRQVPGVTPHSLKVHHTHVKFLDKRKEVEEEKSMKYSKKSLREKARAEKHSLISIQKGEQGKKRSAAHHRLKAAKLLALSNIHHKTAQESKVVYKRAKELSALPPRPTLFDSTVGCGSS